jgi:hypothetical protein
MGEAMKTVVIVMVAAAFSVLGLVASGAGATTAAPRAAVLAVSATPGALGHAGGLAQVKGRVEHAKSCQLELLASQSLTVGYSHNPKPCSGQGAGYSAHIVVGANPSRQSRVVSFALVARNATSSSTKRFSVAVAPRPPLRPKATTTPTTTPTKTTPTKTTPTKTTPTTLAATTTVRRTTTTALPKTAATTAATTTSVFPSCPGRLLASALAARDDDYHCPGDNDGPGDHDVVGHHHYKWGGHYDSRDDVDRSANHDDDRGLGDNIDDHIDDVNVSNGYECSNVNDDEHAAYGGERTDPKLVRLCRHYGAVR